MQSKEEPGQIMEYMNPDGSKVGQKASTGTKTAIEECKISEIRNEHGAGKKLDNNIHAKNTYCTTEFKGFKRDQRLNIHIKDSCHEPSIIHMKSERAEGSEVIQNKLEEVIMYEQGGNSNNSKIIILKYICEPCLWVVSHGCTQAEACRKHVEPTEACESEKGNEEKNDNTTEPVTLDIEPEDRAAEQHEASARSELQSKLKMESNEHEPLHSLPIAKELLDEIETIKRGHSHCLSSFKRVAKTKNAEDSKDENGFCRELSEKSEEDVSEDRDHQSIWEDLLNTRHFHIKPQVLTVFMAPSVRSHPKAIGDIPWPWLREEKWRLHTFSNYPHNTAKSAILLAEDGFAYIGSGKGSDDSVICFFCCSTKKGWHASDVISVVHRELSPDCTMVTKMNCNNIPMATPKDGSGMFSQLLSCGRPQQKSHGQKYGRGHDAIESDAVPDVTQPAHASSSSVQVPKQPTQVAKSAVAATSGQVVTSYQASTEDVPSDTVTSGSTLPRQPSSTTQQPNQVTGTASAQAASQRAHNAPAAPQSNRASSSSNPPSTQPSSGNTSPSVASTNSAAPSSSTTSSAPRTSNTNQTTTTQAGNSQGSSQGSQGSRPQGSGRGPTYGDLGIITERPKRYEYAVRARRLETFEHWPRDHHLKKEDLSAAGFYYAGYGDCARCFYCGGGLRNWEDDDNVWVEHARWFPKCAFIRQQMGQAFVDTVQDLNKDHDQISYKMVVDKMGASASSFQLDTNNAPLKRDPAVKTVVDMGYAEKDVLEAANYVKEQNTVLSADKLFEKLEQDGKQRVSKEPVADSRALGNNFDPNKEKETMKTLKDQNNQLRQQTVCKICMDKEVAVVFLPCGHLVSCTDCAAAMKDCPVCRNHVKGIVRAFMS